jgi:hypothetical protein
MRVISEWISVKDRLPPYDFRVVMHVQHPKYSIIVVGLYHTKGVWYELSNNNHYRTNRTVDYWMPLPKLPKDDNNG